MKAGFLQPLAIMGLWIALGAPRLAAQGTIGPVTLRTDSTHALITSSGAFPGSLSTNAAPFEFDFAFWTDEVFKPNGLFDSCTITIQDETAHNTLVILTADAGGMLWAPTTPGGLVLDPNSIVRTAIPIPSLQPPVPAFGMAFHVSVLLPAAFAGETPVAFVDLFNNLNGIDSAAFFNPVFVPEPAPWALALAGGMVWVLFKRSFSSTRTRGSRGERRGGQATGLHAPAPDAPVRTLLN